MIDQSDLDPGEPCPICDEEVASWSEEQSADADKSYCVIDSEKVEPAGLMNGFSADYIVIYHK